MNTKPQDNVGCEQRYAWLSTDFIGLDTEYVTAHGTPVRRVYLDTAASGLPLRTAQTAAVAFLHHYANTHSRLHFSAEVASEAYAWARAEVLAFFQADPARYTCVFSGQGTTACINRLARMLCRLRPERDMVVISAMEHHSNDLPHRLHAQRVEVVPCRGEAPGSGVLDLDALEDLLRRHGQRVNYIAVTGASNVTGIINPIREVAELGHRYGALVVVDAAQLVAHAPLCLESQTPAADACDFLVFSAHKVYVPGGPGVIVGRRDVLAQCTADEVGGGMVSGVTRADYAVCEDLPTRLEPGTPNLPGTVQLATALQLLRRTGMAFIAGHEFDLLSRAMQRLCSIPGLRIYGDIDLAATARVGVISFNLEGLDHGFVAAVLNDYWNLALRNECFCAHPYVRDLLLPELWDSDTDDPAMIQRRRGMVRASFGLYTTAADIECLRCALDDLSRHRDRYLAEYQVDAAGNYRRLSHCDAAPQGFSAQHYIDRALQEMASATAGAVLV